MAFALKLGGMGPVYGVEKFKIPDSKIKIKKQENLKAGLME